MSAWTLTSCPVPHIAETVPRWPLAMTLTTACAFDMLYTDSTLTLPAVIIV